MYFKASPNVKIPPLPKTAVFLVSRTFHNRDSSLYLTHSLVLTESLFLGLLSTGSFGVVGATYSDVFGIVAVDIKVVQLQGEKRGWYREERERERESE